MSHLWTLRDEAQTHAAGLALADHLRPGDFIGLIGTLGAGKTCLTRGLMEGLWRRDPAFNGHHVTSPTYTLLNLYPAPAPFDQVLHADLYRLEDFDDLTSTGYWDALDEVGLALVEWIDRIPEAWPEGGFRLELAHDGAQRRLGLDWEGTGGEGRLDPLVAAWDALLTRA